MNEQTKTGLEILQSSLLVGVLGNLLLRQTPWGLNAFLFVLVFVAALLMLARRHRPEIVTLNTLSLMGAMVFFASMFLIRDSIELRVYDTIAIIVLMGVVILVNFDVKANIAGAFHYVAGVIWAGVTSVFGPIALFVSDIDWTSMPGNRVSRHLFSVLRGLAIALPLVLVFGVLFMAADAAYEGLVNRAINFDLENLVSHVLLTSLFAWLTAGYLRGAIGMNPVSAAAARPVPASDAEVTSDGFDSTYVEKVAAEPADDSASLPDHATILEHINRSDPPQELVAGPRKRDWQNFDNSVLSPVFTLGTVETVIILGLLDLLFLSFVIVQVPYLFGGLELVQDTPDLKLAEYARRGFGELVVVGALVLPMLLASHWLLRRDSGLPEKIFRALACVQIALLFVIMASAAQRLFLLTGEFGYGMTTVRFYPMVVMIWLAVVFGWFVLTVLRGARKHFAWGALWSAIVILGATNLMNPDAFIARTNIELMERGRDFDGTYHVTELSDDAIPTVLSSLAKMDTDDQCYSKWRLHVRMNDSNEESDLRSWNWSRSRARAALAESHEIFDSHEGCPIWMNFDER